MPTIDDVVEEFKRTHGFTDAAWRMYMREVEAVRLAEAESDRLRAERAARDAEIVAERAFGLEQADLYANAAQALVVERSAKHRALADLAACREAGDGMAEQIGYLLQGGIEMQPTAEGPVTFEAMLMLLQMLGVYRGQWAALARHGAGEAHG